MSSLRPLNPNSATRSNLTVADLFARNKQVTISHKPIPTFEEERKASHSAPPVLILTCADLRCVPEYFFHMKKGEAVILRAIGGRVEPNLSAIVLVDSLFEFKEFVVVHHTDCGVSHIEGLKEMVRSRAPGPVADSAVFDGLDLLEAME
jgi:carbonic anhydrase